jgi:hypothetical protein
MSGEVCGQLDAVLQSGSVCLGYSPYRYGMALLVPIDSIRWRGLTTERIRKRRYTLYLLILSHERKEDYAD